MRFVPLRLPALRRGSVGTTEVVELPLPEPLSGTRWQLRITGVDERPTTDWYTGFPFALPVAISEITLPGV